MGRVVISQEVRDALPAGALARLEADAGSFLCAVCGTHGPGEGDGEGAALVVERYLNGSLRTSFTHERCAPSQLRERAALPEQDQFSGEDILMLAGVLLAADGRPLPFLLVEFERAPALVTPAGDVLEFHVSAALEAGMELVGAVDRFPPLAPGWSLELDAGDDGRLLYPDGAVFADRLPDIPGRWREAIAEREGHVAVFVVSIGLRRRHEDGTVPQGLEQAMRRGDLVGGTVAVTHVAAPDEGSTVRRSLVDVLEGVMRTRASSGTGLDDAPDVVDLPPSTVVSALALPGGMPGLLVDLNLTDDQHARRLLQQLEGEGLTPVRDLNRPLSIAPDGWGYLLWPTQVLVLAAREQQRRKLLFTGFTPAAGWYEDARSYRGGMGLFVGNFGLALREHADPSGVILATMRKRRCVGAALIGMATQ